MVSHRVGMSRTLLRWGADCSGPGFFFPHSCPAQCVCGVGDHSRSAEGLQTTPCLRLPLQLPIYLPSSPNLFLFCQRCPLPCHH